MLFWKIQATTSEHRLHAVPWIRKMLILKIQLSCWISRTGFSFSIPGVAFPVAWWKPAAPSHSSCLFPKYARRCCADSPLLPLPWACHPHQEGAQSRAHCSGCFIKEGQTSCKHFNTSVLPPGKVLLLLNIWKRSKNLKFCTLNLLC